MSFVSSLSVAGVGIGVVFVGLAIIIGFIYLISTVSRGGGKKPKAAKTPAAAPAPAPVATAPAPVQDSGIPADVIAAITAAVAAVWEGDTHFVVRRVRRVGQLPAWKRAGLEEQIYSRM